MENTTVLEKILLGYKKFVSSLKNTDKDYLISYCIIEEMYKSFNFKGTAGDAYMVYSMYGIEKALNYALTEDKTDLDKVYNAFVEYVRKNGVNSLEKL